MLCVLFPESTAQGEPGPGKEGQARGAHSTAVRPGSVASLSQCGVPGRAVVRSSSDLGCGDNLHEQRPPATDFVFLGAISPRTEALVPRYHRRSPGDAVTD